MLAPPIVEPVLNEHVQGITLTNADKLSASRQPFVQSIEHVLYFMKTEIEAMFKKECGRATTILTNLDLKSHYTDKVTAKRHPSK